MRPVIPRRDTDPEAARVGDGVEFASAQVIAVNQSPWFSSVVHVCDLAQNRVEAGERRRARQVRACVRIA
jgi:hypothetical protein